MVPKPPAGTNFASNAVGAPRLPPLPKFRIKRPNKTLPNPCLGLMSSVLGCWASSGHAAAGCAMLEHQLRMCMDAQKPGLKQKSTINYHLGRMYPKIVGPRKRD